MFRKMRRIKQQLSDVETTDILKKCSYGTLAVLGDDDYPYTVPLNYVYLDEKIYFHCGILGHKLDAIKNSNKSSFCVVEKDDIVKEEYTTYFRSVVAFGKLKVIEDDVEKRNYIEKLSLKYFPEDSKENRDLHINKSFKALNIIEMTIEHMTGKEAIELVNMKK